MECIFFFIFHPFLLVRTIFIYSGRHLFYFFFYSCFWKPFFYLVEAIFLIFAYSCLWKPFLNLLECHFFFLFHLFMPVETTIFQFPSIPSSRNCFLSSRKFFFFHFSIIPANAKYFFYLVEIIFFHFHLFLIVETISQSGGMHFFHFSSVRASGNHFYI